MNRRARLWISAGTEKAGMIREAAAAMEMPVREWLEWAVNYALAAAPLGSAQKRPGVARLEAVLDELKTRRVVAGEEQGHEDEGA